MTTHLETPGALSGDGSADVRAARFETADFGQLYAVMNRYCLSLTGSRLEAEDLVQETWLKAIPSLARTMPPNPTAFMLRIAKNSWIDEKRRRAAHVRAERKIKQAEAERVDARDFPGTLGLEAAFQALFRHLTPVQRCAFLLRDVLGYSCEETAAKLGTTEGAVKAALRRARQAMPFVNRDLNGEMMTSPKDEDAQAYWKALAAAYQNGYVSRLVALAETGDLESAAVAALASQYEAGSAPKRRTAIRQSPSPQMRLAA